MGQFLFGLFAGIVVGLVMEWVIDWTGLLPRRAVAKQTRARTGQDGAAGKGTRADGQSAAISASSISNAEPSGE